MSPSPSKECGFNRLTIYSAPIITRPYQRIGNKRLNTAYMLKESFGQLWDYEREPWARKFFENWLASLNWQRLKTYEKFAQMIDDHWDGIAAYCKPENKVSLGFVEGLNGKYA